MGEGERLNLWHSSPFQALLPTGAEQHWWHPALPLPRVTNLHMNTPHCYKHILEYWLFTNVKLDAICIMSK